MLGWIAMRSPGKWASVLLVGLLVIVLVLGFAGGLFDLLQGYATANTSVVEGKTMENTEQVVRSQQVAVFCDDCHSPATNPPRGSEAVSLSDDASIVFMPIEIFSNPSGINASEIAAYPHASGPDLKVVLSNWSQADFLKTLHSGKKGTEIGLSLLRLLKRKAKPDNMTAFSV